MKINRVIFLSATFILVAAIVLLSVAILSQGPRTSMVELLTQDGSSAQVDDLNDGRMTIPYYEGLPTSQYEPDQFLEKDGTVKYLAGNSFIGISVSGKRGGDIDWEQVAASGVDFAMIRVGWREQIKGRIKLDPKFQQNIEGATAAGLPVGVYFFSQAVSDAEAQGEAQFVLEQIRDYSVTYPIAIYWKYAVNDDGSQDPNSRSVRCNGEQVTGFIETFCKKIDAAGFTPCYLASKSMAYESLNLSRLSNIEFWYAEYKPQPSFYYDFQMWQYTEEAEVPGVPEKVPVTIALKEYKAK
ncbi:GH25 family lysozyme [Oscillospiraceae bacterium 42-9]